jgi:Na+/H+ antiporter NhaD/arsenite permease-like protein
VALAIFCLTYAFIAGARLPFLRIDRPGGALLGAVLMVLTGAVLPRELTDAIDFETLLLLLGMMLIASYLSEAAFFRTAGYLAVRWARSPRGLLMVVCFTASILSAFLVNDVVCLMLTPLVLASVETARLKPLPYLLALCMGSNAGSLATFTGNPQNMLIQGSSGMPYGTFAAFMALPALLATAVVALCLLLAFRRELPRGAALHVEPPLPAARPILMHLCLSVLAGVVASFFAGVPMALGAMAGAALLMALYGIPPRRSLERVDFVLLVFFAALFVVVFGIHKAGWPDRMRMLFEPLLAGGGLGESIGLAAVTTLGSNLFSNVPFVMLARHWIPGLQSPELGWQVLALASTLAGNLTLIGSVANIIVFESAGERCPVTFWGYARLGLPITLLTLLVGLVTLWGEHALVG